MKQRFLYVLGLIVILNINLFGARDYSPETGRWTAEDPIGFWSGDINFYAYCANDPVNYIDPSGLSKEGKDGLKKNTTTCSDKTAHKTPLEVNIPKDFKLTKQFGCQHGKKVYQYKGRYYSRDRDGHNGGIWKVFKRSGGKLRRIGTADKDLNIFKN